MFKVKEIMIPIRIADAEGITQGDFYKVIDKKTNEEKFCTVRRVEQKGIHLDFIKTPSFDSVFSEWYINVENVDHLNEKYVFVKMKLVEDKDSKWLGSPVTFTTDPSIEYREALVKLEKEITEAMRPIEQLGQILMKRLTNQKQLREIEKHANAL